MNAIQNNKSAERVGNRTFREIFSGNVRYEIPFFQRGYAWQKHQWEQLFSDLFDDILPDIESGVPIGDVEHFFGPIVVLQKVDDSPDFVTYTVIDGQQRITTIYLLLALLKLKLENLQHLSPKALPYALALRDLLTNLTESSDDYQRLKLFSTKGDRLPTYWAVFGKEHTPVSPHYFTDVHLYRPGTNRVDEFVVHAQRRLKHLKDVDSIWQFAEVLLDSLRVVWIPLDSRKDDPQAIFESLNDKGMPLSASELICSYVFRPLQAVPDFEQLHNMQWLQSVSEFKDRESFEEFLRHLFSIGEKKMIGKGRKVYVHFKNRNKPLSATVARHRLSEIRECAPLYRSIVTPEERAHKEPQIRRLLIEISHTRMDSSTPFVLDVLRSHANGSINTATAVAILNELLTMLVRRKVTERPTTIYDTMFPPMLAQVVNEPSPVRAMQELFRRNDVLTSDSEFKDAMVMRPLYRSRDLAFTRMVLIEVDKHFQSHGQYADYTTVHTIEHVIPQTVDEHWRAYLGSDMEDTFLGTAIHSIGNLCLLSQSANSKAGQNPFTSKVEDFSEVTALARMLKQHVGQWDLAAVRERSGRLADAAIERWKWTQ